MKEFIVKPQETGQRLDRYLMRILPQASKGFIYKMLRKKNIVLNGKKADGHELLQEMDLIRIYFSDETFSVFSGKAKTEAAGHPHVPAGIQPGGALPVIIYEDADILVLNKPAGMLSQKAKPEDYSANDFVIGYLLESGQLKPEDLLTFRPSVCSRLDRNTSGLLIAGKTTHGLQNMSAMLRDRSLRKFYHCIAAGEIRENADLMGYLIKNKKTNRVAVYSDLSEIRGRSSGSRRGTPEHILPIETAYHPICTNGSCTLLEVHLITGRSHQIRAHLASAGHPLLGDWKYGDKMINQTLKHDFGVEHQLLHACRMELPDGRVFTAEDPPIFSEIMDRMQH